MHIEVMKVQMMARWSSPVVTHYTRLAPPKAIASDSKKALEAKTADESASNNKLALGRSFKELTSQLKAYQEELADLKIIIKKLDHMSPDQPYVTNLRTKIRHRVLTCHEDVGINAKTFCKWTYIQGEGHLTREAPTVRAETCETCLPGLKASLQS